MELTEKSLEILQTSRKLFASKGFKAVTTKEIAKEAGVNELTVFRHFKNKENLFKQIILHYISKPDISEFINENENDLSKYLLGIGNLIHTIFLENMDLFKLELVERQRMQSMDLINRFPNEIKEGMINYLIHKHDKSKAESTVYTVSFMTSVHGLCMNLYFLKTFTPAPGFSECLNFIIKKFS